MSALALTDIVYGADLLSADVNAIFAQVENWLNGVTASADITITGHLSCANLTATGNTALGNGADTLTINCSSGITFTPAATWTFTANQTVSGTWANLGTVTTVDINGGTVDGAVIGGSSAAAGTFTTLTAGTSVTTADFTASGTATFNGAAVFNSTATFSSIAISAIDNTPIGSTTPSTGAFTTLSVSNSLNATVASVINSNTSSGAVGLYVAAGSSASNLSFKINDSTGGSTLLQVNGDGSLRLSDGTVSAPSLTYISDTDTGQYRIGANTIGWTTGGVVAGAVDGSQRWVFGDSTSLATGARVTINEITGSTILGAACNLVLGHQLGATSQYTQLGFGNGNSSSTYSPVVIAYLPTSVTDYGQGDLIFALRNATTDTAPTEVFRILGAGTITATGATTFSSTITVTGAATFNGNTSIGNGADTLTVNCSSGITFTPAATWTFSAAQTVSGTWSDLGIVTTVDINGGTIDGAVIGGSSAAAGTFTNLTATGNTALGNGADTLTINCSSGITFTPAATWTFSASQTVSGTWANLGSVTTIDINGGTVDGAIIGGSSAAAGTFTIVTVDNLSIDANTIAASSGKVIIEGVAASEIVHNEAGANVDTRFESDTNANFFFLDASAECLGIGLGAPLAKLQVEGTNSSTIGTNVDFWISGGNSASAFAQFGLGYSGGNTNPPTIIAYDVTDGSGATKGDMAFYLRDVTTDTAPTERMRITSAGDIYTVAWTDYGGTSTVTGFSGTPTTVVRYKKIGRLVFVAYSISGTSNATGFTFTVPYTSANTTVDYGGATTSSTDNTSVRTAASRAVLPANSTTVTLNTNFSNGAWTSSGTKAAVGNFWYEATT